MSNDKSPVHADESMESFRGAVEPIRSGHSWPFTAARLLLSEDKIAIRRLLRKTIAFTKDEVVSLVADQVRYPPLAWRTIVTIKFREHEQERTILFVPFRSKQLVERLRTTGWMSD